MAVGQDTTAILVPDEHYFERPLCIVCRNWNGRRWEYSVNDKLKGGWLHWKSTQDVLAPSNYRWRPDNYEEGDILLGKFDHYELYVDKRQTEKFSDFVIFAMVGATQSSSAISGGSGGGASGGGGGGGGSAKGPQAQPTGILIGPLL